MQTPPLKWWSYPLDEEGEGKEVKGLALDLGDNIFIFGLDKKERDLQWRVDRISPRGIGGKFYTEDFSAGADVTNGAIFDFNNNLILAGFDFEPGSSQWRAIKRGIGQESWSFSQNFSPGPDEITSVAVDLENNVILAGFDSEPGNPQWRVVKLNKFGERLWDYTLNPSKKADVIADVKTDSRNNIILAGYEKSLGNDRWRIEKLDPDKKLLWGYGLDVSDGADVLNAIALDSQDNIIGVGYDFFPGDAQWRVVKLDKKGKRLWQWSFNPSLGFDELRGVAVDSEDNIIVGGYESSKEGFQWVVKKFSPQGDEVWTWTENLSSGFDELIDLAVDSENNVILVGFDFSKRLDHKWRAIKLSERKPVFPQPKVLIQEERMTKIIGNNIIIAKPGSWQIIATNESVIGVINQHPISANLFGEDWQHFAMTYDGIRQRLYLNGKLSNSQALSGEIKTNFNNVFIGYNFPGFIDELKVYNRALSPDQIRSLFKRK
jgi:hypothetical protein